MACMDNQALTSFEKTCPGKEGGENFQKGKRGTAKKRSGGQQAVGLAQGGEEKTPPSEREGRIKMRMGWARDGGGLAYLCTLCTLSKVNPQHSHLSHPHSKSNIPLSHSPLCSSSLPFGNIMRHKDDVVRVRSVKKGALNCVWCHREREGDRERGREGG